MLALVEVRGEQRDQDQAEQEFERRGWPVVTSFPRGEGASAGVLSADPVSRLYCVEVRLFGARNRRTGRAAVWRVQRLAKASRLEMYVRRCDVMDRDREQLTEWQAHTIAYRPPLRPVPRPMTISARLRRRWMMARARYTERRGHHDAGSLVTGTASEARRLARISMPEGAPGRTDIDVRALHGRERSWIVPRREEAGRRRVYRFTAWLLAMAFCAVLAHHHTGFRRWLWVAVAAACFAVGLRIGSRMFESGGRALSVLVSCAAAVFFLGAAFGWFSSNAQVLSPEQTVLLGAVTLTVVGIRLLVRQWTWGEWLAWAAPLAFTMLVSFAVASGSVLHALYADGLGLTPEDLDVPGIWQALSAVKVLGFLSLALFVPAVWGIVKHVHAPFARPGEHLSVPLYVLVQAIVIVQVAGLAADSAGHAVNAVKAAADRGEQPPPYFGVEPEWTCVEPTVPLARLNIQGGELRAERPYLSFGVAGGMVSLWNPDTGEPLKLPSGQVRLLPAQDSGAACRVPPGERADT
ncbi:NnrS multi-domain protein [Streptomyces sp. 21So2-11]|uniref:NnrS multi-domain protein n=1 Tax=Streptomyces sp. 21So2-11 TaxID=3144408 RepID=UPI0032199D29